jgi:hypothetical protein
VGRRMPVAAALRVRLGVRPAASGTGSVLPMPVVDRHGDDLPGSVLQPEGSTGSLTGQLPLALRPLALATASAAASESLPVAGRLERRSDAGATVTASGTTVVLVSTE